MFVKQRCLGFFFKKEDFGESSRVFSLLTREFGRVEILAKGIRKISSKLKSATEIFYLSEIEFVQGKIFKTLTDAVSIEKFKNLRRNLKRLATAYKISEILDLFLKEGREPKCWNLLKEVFEGLDRENLKPEQENLIYQYFFWNFVSLLGYKPEISECVVCRKKLKPEKNFFSSLEGGIVCPNCFKKEMKGKAIGFQELKVLRLIFEKDLGFLLKVKIKKEWLSFLRSISEEYIKFCQR